MASAGLCSVCFQPQDRQQKGLKLVRCRVPSCKLQAHKDCYCPHEPGPGAFTCTPCRVGVRGNPVCDLCPVADNRAMRRTIEGTWVHELCAAANEAALERREVPLTGRGIKADSSETEVRIAGVPELLRRPKPLGAKCTVCNSNAAPTFSCACPHCSTACHLSCALQDAEDPEADVCIIWEGDGPQVPQSYICPQHYIECPCCEQFDTQQDTVECRHCQRIVHTGCSNRESVCALCEEAAKEEAAAARKRGRKKAAPKAAKAPTRKAAASRTSKAGKAAKGGRAAKGGKRGRGRYYDSEDEEELAAATPEPRRVYNWDSPHTPMHAHMPRDKPDTPLTPRSLRPPVHNPNLCGVCLLGPEPEAPISKCSICHVKVHAICFPPADNGTRSFVCPLCAKKASTLSCVLCPIDTNRAMVREEMGKSWAHLTCMVWTPEVSFDSDTATNIHGVAEALEVRRNLVCERCGMGGGAPIQCSEGACKRAFHPMCALGFNHVADLEARRMLCQRHSNDHFCETCGEEGGATNMLLCDDCNNGYHITCLDPPLETVPEAEWYCDGCANKRVQQGTLIDVSTVMGAAEPGQYRFRVLDPALLANMPRPAALLSSDEDSDGGWDEGDDDDEEEAEELPDGMQPVEAFADVDDSSRRRSTEFTARNRGASEYFTSHNGGGASNKRLSRAAEKKRKGRGGKGAAKGDADTAVLFPGHKDVVGSIGQTERSHVAHTSLLCETYRSRFARWRCQLLNGFNLLFYGFGSKRGIVSEFARKALVDANVLEVQGFSPTVTAKTLTTHIVTTLMEDDSPPASLSAQVTAIVNFYSGSGRDAPRLYVVLHNIDGPELRSPAAQTALAQLAGAPNLFLIASVDHVNAPFMWQQLHLARFNWAWQDVTTFAPYSTEAIYEAPALGASKDITARGVRHVLQSLTPNHRSVLAVLARHQSSGNGSLGLEHHELLARCREDMLAHTDMQLRTFLIELQDHALVVTRRSAVDGREFLHVPHSDDTLQLIMAWEG